MIKQLTIFMLIPIIASADDFKIIRTNGNTLIAQKPEQEVEPGQKFYIMNDSLVTGEAYVTKIVAQYCVLELSEGRAYAGDKLIQLTKLQKAKYILAKKRQNENKQAGKLQAAHAAYILITAFTAIIIYSYMK